jgi:cell wall-associated NlpC family hydrolase
MQSALVALVPPDLTRAAWRLAAGLGLALLIALAFAVASVMTLFYGVLPARDAGVTRPAAPAPAGEEPRVPIGAGTPAVIGVASAFIGTPYVWGGASPRTGFDCSGLTQWSYAQVGVRLPRTAQMQYDATARVGREQLRPGDLVFFERTYYAPGEPITHVGIYLGDGQMISAPVEGKPISVQPVFTGFWGQHFAGGGRPR